MTDLSVVIPTLNSERRIELVVREIVEILGKTDFSYEIIIVDDASEDATWSRVRELVLIFPEICGIRLRENSGQHAALQCGIQESRGTFIVTMDDDGQHDASEIANLVRSISEGQYDVVFAKLEHPKTTQFRGLASKMMRLVYRMVGSRKPIPPISSFRALNHRAANVIRLSTNPEFNANAELITADLNLGSRKVSHRHRIQGMSTYGLIRLLRLTKRISISYSTKPLRWASRIAVLSATLSLLGIAAIALYQKQNGSTVPGWTSLFIVINALSLPVLLVLGMISEYLAVYIESSRRPLRYSIVDRTR